MRMTGVELIARERERQMRSVLEDGEGYKSSHDDKHDKREIACAAHAYLDHYTSRAWVFENDLDMPGVADGPKTYRSEPPPDSWPWDNSYWNPQEPLRDLVKAGALIAAEIDRLIRNKPTPPLAAADEGRKE